MTAWRGEAVLALIIVAVLAVMIVPMAPPMLDALLAISISSSILILLVSLSGTRPLEFSVFPTLLLVTTIFRLGLNVASTRLILLNGASGTGGAGRVVGAFGNFVVGGNVVVGLVVFAILVIINFVVITRGAGRIAEVSARFVLDALPGKQMSVDAELGSGALNDIEARARRSAIEQEADFFGAMDGASKFVRGDAVAGLIITGINIVGGLVVGTLQHGMTLAGAARSFTILTVGDGLVSQIPALLISTAAGAVVTRASTGNALAPTLGQQVFGDAARLRMAAAAAVVIGLVPGMPLILFVGVAGVFLLLARRASKHAAGARAPAAPTPTHAEGSVEEALELDRLQLEVGYALVELVDASKGGEILRRLQAVRHQIATELGLILPSVHVRDDLTLAPGGYRILLTGQPVASGELRKGELLAMTTGEDTLLQQIPGVDTHDPAFGLTSRWISRQSQTLAEQLGLATVDAATVLATHFSEVVRQHAAELLGRQEVHRLIEHLQASVPKLVEDLVPGQLSVGDVHAVLRGLLREGVSIRDLQTIFEALAEWSPKATTTRERIEGVRRALARQICTPLLQPGGAIWAYFLDRRTEQSLRDSLLVVDGDPALAPDLGAARRLLVSVERALSEFERRDLMPVLVVAADLRCPLRDLIHRFLKGVTVLSHRELPRHAELRALGVLGEDATPPGSVPIAATSEVLPCA
ncbi:MAG: flagellar biosynthesis protein FlhA [Pseudomonadota bacterium]